MQFQGVFMLFPTPAGGLYVRNESFRTGPGSAALNNAAGGEVASSFAQSYYSIFDSDRRALAAIYVRAPACVCAPVCACVCVCVCVCVCSETRPCSCSRASPPPVWPPSWSDWR